MEIDVSQLQVGDEFIYSTQGSLARGKVLRPPVERKQAPRYSIVGKIYYKSLKCKVSMVETVYQHTYSGKVYTYKKKKYSLSNELNTEKYLDLNGKNIWLIKRENYEY